MYHAARAVLLTRGLDPKSHHGVNTLLGMHFFQKGELAPKYARVYAKLQRLRELAEYDRGFVVTKEDAEEDFNTAQDFCEAMKEYMRKVGFIE